MGSVADKILKEFHVKTHKDTQRFLYLRLQQCYDNPDKQFKHQCLVSFSKGADLQSAFADLTRCVDVL